MEPLRVNTKLFFLLKFEKKKKKKKKSILDPISKRGGQLANSADSDLGFSIGTILAIFNLQVPIILPTKF